MYRLAQELALTGWVKNSPQGVFVEVEGPPSHLEEFRSRLKTENPSASRIHGLQESWLEPLGFDRFEIRESETQGDKSVLVLPDLATCPDCLRDLFDPGNRRHRYPFTNCTHCGPRFSIIETLPYDRANTAMKQFEMCPDCLAEYHNPRDRRFHAQPNACPVCGPRLEFWLEESSKQCPVAGAALQAAVDAIRQGKIVAVKGIGGFHLMADARNASAVRTLRNRKQREEKPFALLYPSLARLKMDCAVSPLEEKWLLSVEAPIVLLARLANPGSEITPEVAPGNPCLGVMLPSNPLHHLLMAELGFPVVATSGNLSDEPICIDEREALVRLRNIADAFLVYNRPIVRHMDDSILRVVLGREILTRRARGFAPLPVMLGDFLPPDTKQSVLALGAHLKNAVALAVGHQAFISQHIGDLETAEAELAFQRVAADLPRLYEAPPQIVVSDLHPDYLSTKYAGKIAKKMGEIGENDADPGCSLQTKIGVQHHLAHVLSVIAEQNVALPVVGIAWDGTGYGIDGTIWGGEFFCVNGQGAERIARLRPFRLPGGDAAVREPRRAALGLLFELYGEKIFERVDLAPVAAFNPHELAMVRSMLKRGLNAPLTSSIGRLFDAVAALIGLRQHMHFEGQAAMELEFISACTNTDAAYELRLRGPEDARLGKGGMVLDWQPLVEAVLADLQAGVARPEVSAKFHNALVQAAIAVARRVGELRVAISGGCFQNGCLLEKLVAGLRTEGFEPYWHQQVPCNDGGIALGQIYAATRQIELK